MATEKQTDYIDDLLYRCDGKLSDYTDKELDEMSQDEISDLIETLKDAANEARWQ